MILEVQKQEVSTLSYVCLGTEALYDLGGSGAFSGHSAVYEFKKKVSEELDAERIDTDRFDRPFTLLCCHVTL